ncbi:MAG: sodium:proton exchanger [Spirochaetes bacterium GWD1_61_31]|nr:MAG: sodium:proton exchanger [Spirochaetes bacterium GWB1_60_80]OHD34799.1 MAG: sodium:proton exchanger [Spirochaetes bacterium GWC1_61_12]OHD41735.1 MAG: sodium:proton exchanger [Spirochaetes bacterium GWD1_61_31]OHD44627.1 MAG: sodium:proton exchanger [Spirochaetes bacterium GWE1_60_18]OHD57952.1 MAG: sodium:proton exchanger [Spirochaetes bacterium GWF1_60_12]
MAAGLYANSEGGSTEAQANLVIQIGILLFAVKLGGKLAHLARVPSVLGELIAGILIGPYALGAIPLPFLGFPHGLFSLTAGAALPISPELYGISTIASIILLFVSGLETDLSLFLRYSVAGGLIGIGGVLFSFVSGDLVGVLLFGGGFMDPQNLFLGIMSTATSVGITARILSDRKKMDSPEGVTILAAAVFDDVLGIIFLAVVMGITAISQDHGGGAIQWGRIGLIALKAFGIWLGFTVVGLLLAKRIAKFLKRFKNASSFSILALGMALLLAGLFEKEGLAMIIGAYVLGLSLSKTDISHIITEKLHVLYEFFIPVFFAVMGMLVDVSQFLKPEVIIGGLVFTGVAIVAKVLGCGLPALFTGFNFKGALRIGVGMVPRGEVALIIAGIGMSAGILTPSVFGMSIMMTLITTVVAPFGLNTTLRLPGSGTRKLQAQGESETVEYQFPSEDVALLVTDTITHQLQSEGFYVKTMDIGDDIAQVRKNDTAFSMQLDGPRLEFQGTGDDIPIVHTAVFEAVATLNASFSRLKTDFDPASLNKQRADQAGPAERPPAGAAGLSASHASAFDPFCVSLDLQGDSKEAVIRELLGLLQTAGKIVSVDTALAEIMAREQSMSTGMQDGIAIPHAKSDTVEHLVAAVGLKRGGMDFASLDGQPTTIVVLSLSPKKHPEAHLEFLAGVGSILHDPAKRQEILQAGNAGALAHLLGA